MQSFGPLYVGKLQYWHRHAFPVVEVGSTQETEHPYRKGKCLVFRVPFTHPGYYVGLWVSTPNIHQDDDESIDKLLFNVMKSREAWKPDDGLFDEFFSE